MTGYRAFNDINSFWMEHPGVDDDIVISSRVRLARNSADFPFSEQITVQEERKFLERVAAIPNRKEENGFEDFDFIDLSLIPVEEKQVLVEKHQISPALAMAEGATGLLINAAETISVMVNEEDHLRIQSIFPGLSVRDCWRKASAADDMISQYIPAAFDSRWGYLTSCPTNAGTGMRASAMLHLPAITMTGQVKRFLGNLPKYGFTFRGLYGEGSACKGNLFQISNQITMGVSEEEIIGQLMDIVSSIVKREREMREILMERERLQLEDRVIRAEALLTHAKLLTVDEAFDLLSDLRLGIDLGILKQYNPKIFNTLMIQSQVPVLEKFARETRNSQNKMTPLEQNQQRAVLIRKKLIGGAKS
ncbi:MAG: protein arginine kinase [Bacillota bacterium]|nr:protein arginine kinase [Bacillota bacterium]